MKFGALLRTSAGEVPELQELFTAYKQLKKHLKVTGERQVTLRARRNVDRAWGGHALTCSCTPHLSAPPLWQMLDELLKSLLHCANVTIIVCSAQLPALDCWVLE